MSKIPSQLQNQAKIPPLTKTKKIDLGFPQYHFAVIIKGYLPTVIFLISFSYYFSYLISKTIILCVSV